MYSLRGYCLRVCVPSVHVNEIVFIRFLFTFLNRRHYIANQGYSLCVMFQKLRIKTLKNHESLVSASITRFTNTTNFHINEQCYHGTHQISPTFLFTIPRSNSPPGRRDSLIP